MKFDQLPQIEAAFKSQNAANLIPFSATVAGENLTLNGLLYTPPRTGYYYPTAYTKQRIVLHFTAGNLRSDIMSLTRQDYHVSVAFVVARDGTIYQLHPSKAWSGHIGAGIGNQGTSNREDKASIGIELSNYAYLIPRDGNLETIYSRLKDPHTGKIGPVDTYCTQAQTHAYTKIDTPFRDQQYYASYTPEQIESTIILLRFLTAKYQIPRKFLPVDKRFVATNDVVSFKGIVSHINYRPSGKWDIGPAFDWDTLINGVTAPVFTPSLTLPVAVATRGTVRAATAARVSRSGVISESEVDALYEKAASKSKTRGAVSEDVEATDNEGYNPNDYDRILKTAIPASSGKLYALLIGINKYSGFDDLGGCVNDIKKIDKYIKSRPEFDSHIAVLLNEDATKKNIIKGFRTHLAKATKADTVLIYYSGHGTREDANHYWDESDNTLECLVCQDKGLSKDADYLLADKEQRYLLYELYEKTKAHIVAMFDCCHSGDNTRGAAKVAARNKTARKRFIVTERPSGAFEMRKWRDFIFSKDLAEPTKKVNLHQLLPEAPHIQFAACEQDQSAIEEGGEGVFTKYLLSILDSTGGNLTYATLGSQLTQAMRFTQDQTPKVYAPLQHSDVLSNGFLNRPVTDSDASTIATYNTKRKWQINKGAIHNVQPDTVITIYPNGNRDKPVNAKVKAIYIDYTTIEPAATLAQKSHPADVSGLLSRKLLLALDNWHGHLQDTKALIEEIIRRAGGYYVIEGKDKYTSRQADYELTIRNGDVILTRPDDQYRPLVRPLPLVDAADVKGIVDMLIQVAKWHFIKELRNTNPLSTFNTFPLSYSVSIKKGNAFQKLKPVNNAVQLALHEEGGEWTGSIQIEITNTSKKPVYVAALYLDKHFGSMADLLPGRTHFLEKGGTVLLEASNDTELQIALDEQARQYNWPLMTDFIQLIASEENFDAQALTLKDLKPPYVLSDQAAGARKSGIIKVKESPPKKVDYKRWQTNLIMLELHNPLYNVPDEAMLQALLEYDETSMYAAGIWYDVKNDEFGQPTLLVLKEEMIAQRKRGLVGDFKIWLGNTIETAQRRKLYRRLKDKLPRIVAEGDSWFQYPLILKDILDQLYKLYAIRSFAEAGDTLENYMKKREYLQALKEEKPILFLVSGGGNDILGSEFQEFLHDHPPAETDLEKRWLNQKFYNKLLQLKDWYDEMFKEVIAKHPDIHIITHSYDYIIPIDTVAEPKTTSWLGKYMIRNGMEVQSERAQLIRIIVDKFNDNLKEVVKKYETHAHYLDLRGIVREGVWHDEIHPKNEGFEIIADQFVTVIEALRAKPAQRSGVRKSTSAKKAVKKSKKLIAKKAPSKKAAVQQGTATGKATSGAKQAAKKPAITKRMIKPKLSAGNDSFGTRPSSTIKGKATLKSAKRSAVKKAHKLDLKRTRRTTKKGYGFDYELESAPPPTETTPPPTAVKKGRKAAKKATSAKKAPSRVSQLRSGHMAYDIPESMEVGKLSVCKIRIAGLEVTREVLVEGEEADYMEIKIANEMSVRLTDTSGGDKFKIVPLSTEKQGIVDNEVTQWEFNVTPKDSTSYFYELALHITAHIDGVPKDIEVLRKTIHVRGEKGKRVVFMAADTTRNLDLRQESQVIREQLGKENASYYYTEILDLSVVKLEQVLVKENPAILHYSGHSELEGILLFGEGQSVTLATPEELKALFNSSKSKLNIECIVLNSCYSRGQASALQPFTKFMIGTTSKVKNKDAISFSRSFYLRLFENEDHRNAFDGALISLNIPKDDRERVEQYFFYPN